MKTGDTTIPGVVLCCGPEKWLRIQAVDHLRQICIAPGFEEMDLVRIDNPADESEAILGAARTAPFGSARRLVIVEGFNQISESAVPWLPAYLACPNEKACLVLCSDRAEREMKLFSAYQKEGTVQVVLCQPLKGSQLKEWISNQGRLLGKGIDPDAVTLLVTRLGEGLQTLSLAVESLSLLVGDRPKISAADVEALIAPSVRETAFDILDLAAAGRLEAALGQFRQALTSNQLSVEQFMGALGWYYRMVWKTRRGEAVASWNSPNRQTALTRLIRWPISKLRRALEEVLEADAGLKQGYPAPELRATQLLLKLGS